MVSDAVYNNVKNKSDIAATDLGEHELKHVANAIRLYAIGS